MITTNQLLTPFTIVKVKNYTKFTGHLCIREVEIVTPGNQVGVKLGNPVEIGYDGKIPDLMEAKLTALR